jgi:hypothetical protein
MQQFDHPSMEIIILRCAGDDIEICTRKLMRNDESAIASCWMVEASFAGHPNFF